MQKTVAINGNQLAISTTTGQVLSTTKAMETSVQGNVSGGGGRLREGSGKLKAVDLTIASTTIVHDQVFLADENGREHSFQLKGFNLACREGNSLSVITAGHLNSVPGPYVAVINNTTQNRFFNDAALRRVCQPARLPYIAGFLAAILLVLKVFSGWLIVVLLLSIPFVFALAYGTKTDKGIADFKKMV